MEAGVNALLRTREHEVGPGTWLRTHRSDFGLACGLGAYQWEVRPSDVGGLVWVFDGVMTVHVADRRWLLTPQHAVWMPAGVAGEVMPNVASRAMYVQCSPAPFGPRVRRLAVPPIAGDLLHSLVEADGDAVAARLWSAAAGELRAVHDPGLRLPIPGGELAWGVADAIMRDPSRHRTLQSCAEEHYVSAKTLQRAFARETGLTFPRWRAHARLNASLPALSRGEPVQDVARQVGYQSTVGYIDAFRAHFATTPGVFFGRRGVVDDAPAAGAAGWVAMPARPQSSSTAAAGPR